MAVAITHAATFYVRCTCADPANPFHDLRLVRDVVYYAVWRGVARKSVVEMVLHLNTDTQTRSLITTMDALFGVDKWSNASRASLMQCVRFLFSANEYYLPEVYGKFPAVHLKYNSILFQHAQAYIRLVGHREGGSPVCAHCVRILRQACIFSSDPLVMPASKKRAALPEKLHHLNCKPGATVSLQVFYLLNSENLSSQCVVCESVQRLNAEATPVKSKQTLMVAEVVACSNGHAWHFSESAACTVLSATVNHEFAPTLHLCSVCSAKYEELDSAVVAELLSRLRVSSRAHIRTAEVRVCPEGPMCCDLVSLSVAGPHDDGPSTTHNESKYYAELLSSARYDKGDPVDGTSSVRIELMAEFKTTEWLDKVCTCLNQLQHGEHPERALRTRMDRNFAVSVVTSGNVHELTALLHAKFLDNDLLDKVKFAESL